MKFKTTAKAVRNGYNNIVCAGYCDAQALLRNHEPVAYTRGVYGWNFDVYEIDGVCICTGYRGMPGRKVSPVMHDLERKASDIWNDYSHGRKWDDKCAEVDKLLAEWIEEEKRIYHKQIVRG